MMAAAEPERKSAWNDATEQRAAVSARHRSHPIALMGPSVAGGIVI
jgi:hypothetical protein